MNLKRFAQKGNTVVKVLVFIVVVAAIAGYRVYQKEKQEKLNDASNQIVATSDEMRRKMQEEMKRDGFVSTKTALESGQKLQEAMAEQAAKVGGEDGQAMKIAADFTARIQTVAKPYAALMETTEISNPFELTTAKTKEDLVSRRQFATEMLRLSNAIKDEMEVATSKLRDAFKEAGLTSKRSQALLDDMCRGFESTLPANRKIRATDEVLAKGLLELCDFAEKEWGKWKVEDGQMIFDDQQLLDQFNAIGERIGKAADEQIAAQQELLKSGVRR